MDAMLRPPSPRRAGSRRALIAPLLLAASLAPLLGGAATAAPVELPECLLSSGPRVLGCEAAVAAGGLEERRAVEVWQRAAPNVARLPAGASWSGLWVLVQEEARLGAEGTSTSSAHAGLNLDYTRSWLPLQAARLEGAGYKCYEASWNDAGWQYRDYPCLANTLPFLVSTWCYSPSDPYYNECAGVRGSEAHHCAGSVVRVVPGVPPLLGVGPSVPGSLCMDTQFHQRLLQPGAPRLVLDLSSIGRLFSAPPSLTEHPAGAGNGVAYFELRPYQASTGTSDCHGHHSPGGFLGTQEVCLR